MKQIHKVWLKLSRGPLGFLVGNRSPLDAAFSSLLTSYLCPYNPSREDHSPFYSRDVIRMDRPCFLPPQTSQCMWLMQALGFLLSALQVEEILKNLHSLISPYIQQLEKLAEEIVSELWGCGTALGPRGFSVGTGVGMLELPLRSSVEQLASRLGLGDLELDSILPIA